MTEESETKEIEATIMTEESELMQEIRRLPVHERAKLIQVIMNKFEAQGVVVKTGRVRKGWPEYKFVVPRRKH